MNKLKSFLLLATVLVSFSMEARILLSLKAIHKMGIDKGLVLVSELHSKNEVFDERVVKIKMNNGFVFNLKASFQNDFKSYGPSSMIRILGTIVDKEGNTLADFSEDEWLIDIGENDVKTIEVGSTQLIELTLKPDIL